MHTVNSHSITHLLMQLGILVCILKGMLEEGGISHWWILKGSSFQFYDSVLPGRCVMATLPGGLGEKVKSLH